MKKIHIRLIHKENKKIFGIFHVKFQIIIYAKTNVNKLVIFRPWAYSNKHVDNYVDGVWTIRALFLPPANLW